MPRQYKAGSGCHKKHDPEKIKQALDDLDSGISLKKTSDMEYITVSSTGTLNKVEILKQKMDKRLLLLVKKVF